MAKEPTCAPYATKPLIVNSKSGESFDLHLDATMDRYRAEVRSFDNTDPTNTKRIYQQLESMMGLDLAQLDSYVTSQLAKVAKGKGAASEQIKENAKEQIIAATNIIWQRSGAGLKQLAANYLLKRKEGQQALGQAELFFNNMKGFNSLGREIADANLRVGSALRQRKLAKKLGFMDDFDLAEEVNVIFSAETNAQIAERADAFEAIAEKLNAGNLDEALQDIDKIAAQIDMMDDPRQIAGTISRWRSSWNIWDEVWINGLLSSTGTFVTNAVGAAWVVMRPLLQSGFAKTIAATGIGGPEFTKAANLAAAEAGAQIAAMQSSFMDAAMLGWDAFKKEESIFRETTQRITAENFRKNPLLGKIPAGEEIDRAINVVGQMVRLPSRGMLGMDEFAKVIALRGEVAAAGVYRGVRQGVDATDYKQLQKYVNKEISMAFDIDAGSLKDRYRFNPAGDREIDVKAQQYLMNLNLATMDEKGLGGRDVYQRMAESVFQEENEYAKAINGFVNNSPFRPVLKPFIPFVQTPANILKQGMLDSTGVGAVANAFTIWKKEGFDPTKTFNAIQYELLKDPGTSARIGGQIAFMTLVGGATYGLAMSGVITGGGPGQWATGRNARLAQQAWEQNNVPYSIGFPGGPRIPLSKLGEPFAVGLRIIADIGFYSGYMDRTEQDFVTAQALGMMAAGLFEASYLQGLDDLFTLLRAGAEGNLDYEAGRATQNFVATQMPFGSLLAQVDRSINPYRAAYDGLTFSEMFNVFETSLGEGFFGKLVNRLPGVDTNPMLVDQLTGEYVPIVPGTGPNGLNPLQQAIPFFPRGSKNDDVWEFVFSFNGQYSEKGLSNGLQPTTTEQQEFNRTMATVLINGKTVAQAIREFSQRPDVREFIAKNGLTLKSTKLQREFQRILEKYRYRAMTAMFAANPNLAERRQVEKSLNRALSRGDIDGARGLEEVMLELLERGKKGY